MPEITNTPSEDVDPKDTVSVEELGSIKLSLEQLTGGSLLSRPYTTVNVREPNIDLEQSGFVYNHYTVDERLPIQDQALVSSQNFLSINEFNNQFLSPDKTLPRYNRIVFNHEPTNPDIQQGPSSLIDNFLGSATDSNGGIDLRVDRIITEGTFSNMFFASANLIDTNMDKTIYDNFNASIAFNETITGTASETTISNLEERVNKYINRSTEESNNPQVVRQFVNQLSRVSQGVMDENLDQSKKDDFLLKVRHQNFILGFNSLFIDDIMTASTDESLSAFEDEIRALKIYSTTLQNKAIQTIQASNVSISDFQNIYSLGFLHDYKTTGEGLLESDIGTQLPHVKHIGYAITKTERTTSGDFIQHEPRFFGKPNLGEIIDSQVVYGHVFSYKVRAVSAIEYDFVIRDNEELSDTKIRGLFFVASRASTIKFSAKETVPPKPPSFLRMNYQRRKGLLIEWDHPINSQRDIIAYLIYRRKSTSSPFVLIREINFDQSAIKTQRLEKARMSRTTIVESPQPYFLDEDFNNDSNFIYSVVSVDAHGMTSNYSPQYRVIYDRPTNKIRISCVSTVSAPKAYPNLFLTSKGRLVNEVSDIMIDNAKVSDCQRMTVYYNPEYYHVFKQNKAANNNTTNSNNEEVITTEDLKFLQAGTQAEEPVYQIHLVNTDLLKDQIVNICINDKSMSNIDIPVADLEENNFSFELLHPDKYE